MQDYKKLRAFELADELVIAVYHLTRHFPTDEKFGLTSQLRRAAISIASNIVEGCSRESQIDFARFIEIAFGSAREVEYQLSVAQRLELTDLSEFAAPTDLSNETCKVLNGLLRSIRSRH
jgi:four helix bundle protein